MEIIDLQGEWNLVRKSTGETIQAQVPGDIFSANLKARKIADPFWAKNEEVVEWVGREEWIYFRKFFVDKTILEMESLFLNCDSLDTLASVYINGRFAGSTNNMFLRQRLDVKNALTLGENTINIFFKPIYDYAVQKAEAQPRSVPYVASNLKVPHMNQVRKAQCHGGWDWGLALVTAGIYGKIYIGAVEKGRIESVTTQQKHDEELCVISVSVDFMSTDEHRDVLTIKLGEEIRVVPVTLKKGLNRIATDVTVRKPELWWPRGYGKQVLYNLEVSLAGETLKKRIGLRKVDLIAQKDSSGTSMIFRINGKPVFCKGANWIPVDAMPGYQTPARYEALLDSALAANMNMIRVWGGGQYEQDCFYRMCDEKGIMVWQDMMFACSLYPADEEFLISVEKEIRWQIRRLMDHPSILIWCGDNEVVEAFGWYPESRKDPDIYLADYNRLNQEVIRKVVEEEDRERPFWCSSPSNGPGLPAVNETNKTESGDCHIWTVWQESLPLDSFSTLHPRFCSEFGFQSFPSMQCIKKFAPKEQWDVESDVMLFHQRAEGGNGKIRNMLERYFSLPADFETFVRMSQILQGVAIQGAIDSWRLNIPECMGILYWQLNDLWPVCSWSSIEYGGKWKLLHYFVKRAFTSPAALPRKKEDGNFEFFIVNDTYTPCKAKTYACLMSFSGELFKEEHFETFTSDMSVEKIADFIMPESLPAKEELFLHLHTTGSGYNHESTYFFEAYRNCKIEKPNITIGRHIAEEQMIIFELETDKPAFFVTLDAGDLGGEFSDNGFTMLPGNSKKVIFHDKKGIAPEKLLQDLVIHSYTVTEE